MNEMEGISEIKIPKGVDRIAVKQHDDRVVIEFIPEKRKFKVGDKVKIKDGISSKTHIFIRPHFTSTMDEFIGKELTVKEYTHDGFVVFNESYLEYRFSEDWIEPWSDELKKGDLAIFWDDSKELASVRIYMRKDGMLHYDHIARPWQNVIKFESKEQFEKLLRGEI